MGGFCSRETCSSQAALNPCGPGRPHRHAAV